MSIKRMTAVWEHSQTKGNMLLLLLAIADNANDIGYAWPGVEYLAKKTRSSKSTVLRNTKRLEQSRELYVEHNKRTGNKYIVTVGMPIEQIEEALKKHFKLDEERLGVILTRFNLTPQKSQNDTSEVSPMIHEPSITIKETSIKSAKTADFTTSENDQQPQDDPPAPEPPPKKPRARSEKQKAQDAILDAIKDAWGVSYGLASSHKAILTGTSKRYKTCNVEEQWRVTSAEQVQEFDTWYRLSGWTLPTAPAKIQNWWERFHKAKELGEDVLKQGPEYFYPGRDSSRTNGHRPVVSHYDEQAAREQAERNAAYGPIEDLDLTGM